MTGIRNLIALLIIAAAPSVALAQPRSPTVTATAGDEDDPDAAKFVRDGNIEIGGALGASFNEDTMTLVATPTVGLYIRDRWQMSALFTITYVRQEDMMGERDTNTTGAILAEPSYHHPFADNMLVLGGLGIGAGYNGENMDFRVVPRVGLNMLIGEWSAITPSVKLPILVGEAHGDDGDVGSDLGVVLDVTLSTIL